MTTTPLPPGARGPLRLLAAAAAAGLLTLSLTACQIPGIGEEADTGDSAGEGGDADAQDAMLEYAQCMRDNGVPMDDPDPDGGGLLVNGQEVDPEALRAAEEECGHLIEDVLPDEGEMEIPQEQREALLAQAQCMRERGWDVPDPQFDGGGVRMQLDDTIDPSDPAFQRDHEECAEESGVDMPQMEDGS